MIETQKTSYTQSYAHHLLQLANVQGPPVPVEHIVALRGAELRYVSFDEELSGLIFEERGQTIIGVNAAHPATRQRFTIAHELGHLEMHQRREFHIDRHFRAVLRGDKRDPAWQGSSAEREANAFAFELLIPSILLLNDLRGTTVDYESDERIARLAERYEVSEQAMLFRLISLGFIPAL